MIRPFLQVDEILRAFQPKKTNVLAERCESLLRRLGLPRGGLHPMPYALGIAGYERGAGASTLAVNLAIRAAQSNARVLLVDGNNENATATVALGADLSPGLSEAIHSAVDPLQFVQATHVENLRILSAGSSRVDIEPEDCHQRLGELVKKLKHHFGLIVVDLPAAHESTSCCRLAGQLDGVLFVLAPDVESESPARRAASLLNESGSNLLGVVLNKV